MYKIETRINVPISVGDETYDVTALLIIKNSICEPENNVEYYHNIEVVWMDFPFEGSDEEYRKTYYEIEKELIIYADYNLRPPRDN